MGAKLTKSKSLSISGKSKEHQADITATVENSNYQIDVTTDGDDKQTANNKNKKKKEKSNTKSSKTKVDKGTNTDNCVLPSSSFAEQLVGEKASALSKQVCLNTSTSQGNATHQSELPNKDAQELRDACFRNGIISTESSNGKQRNSNIVEEVVTDVPATIFANVDQVHYKEQQQFVES